MEKTKTVQQSARYIAENAEHVTINTVELSEIAEKIYSRMNELQYDFKYWKSHKLHPQCIDSKTMNWIFLIDLLNYSFWAERSVKKRFTVSYDGTAYTGYWSLCAVINRCIQEGIPITDPRYYSQASVQELKHALRPDSDEYDTMPLLDKRIEMLHRAGSILVMHFDGDFANCVQGANQSAQQLIQLVIEYFGDLFDDRVLYKGNPVILHKRVQILVADIWACYEGQGLGTFKDIDSIAMFADYRVPQGLVYHKLLQYSPSLLQTLKTHEQHHESTTSDPLKNHEFMLERGHPYEVEIRGCSIHAVELLVEEMKSKGNVNAIIVDFYLWDIAKQYENEMVDVPIHRTRSIYY